MRIIPFLFLLIAAPCLQAESTRLALVIGNSNYQELRPLKNPARDAREVARKLKGMGFILIGKRGKPVTGPVLNLNGRDFFLAVKKFAKAAKGAEIALVYYAGHGMQDSNQSYLLPVDVHNDDLELVLRDSIGLEGILKRLDGKAKLTVAVFDACREIPELENAIAETTRSSGAGASDFRGLARPQSEGRSRLVAFAGAAGQLVKDGKGRHSPYTDLLLQELDTKEAPVEQVFQEVAYGFGRRYGGQNPEVLIQGVRPRHYYFIPPPPPVMPPPPMPPVTPGPVADPEIMIWQSLDRCGSEACYRAYLDQYPNGRFSAAARARVAHVQPNQPTAPELTPFTVKTTPESARVRIMNIVPKYHDGIKLKPGKYLIEATKSEFRKHLGWYDLTAANPVYMAVLEKAPLGPRAGQTWRDPTTGMKFIYVPKGCFQMGSNHGDSDELPVHRVCVGGFWLGKYEVTQGQWKKVMGSNPSYFRNGNSHPVEKVSWDDVQAYIRKLNVKGGAQFRLPSEAEWEYACCSGGKDEKYSGSNSVDRVAWYDGNSDYKTHKVGTKSANGLGLHDMSGNVWEWVQDVYGFYSSHSKNNPVNTGGGSYRVSRGGSWNDRATDSRCAYRNRRDHRYRSFNLGFRLLRK